MGYKGTSGGSGPLGAEASGPDRTIPGTQIVADATGVVSIADRGVGTRIENGTLRVSDRSDALSPAEWHGLPQANRTGGRTHWRTPAAAGHRSRGLGDTAFDAEAIRLACVKRDFTGIVPIDPERVLAGEKPHPQVRMLANEWTAKPFPAIRLDPNTGTVAMRRLSKYGVGPKIQSRIDSAHSENPDVHSVGKVRLVFFDTGPPTATERPDVQKILMTHDRSQAEVVEWYDLRGQIEWFFKELKSTRGFGPYRFRQFAKVEGGLAMRRETGRADRKYLADALQTEGGIRHLRRQLDAATQTEYRTAL